MSPSQASARSRRALRLAVTAAALAVAFLLGAASGEAMRSKLDEWSLFVRTWWGPTPYQGYMRQGELPGGPASGPGGSGPAATGPAETGPAGSGATAPELTEEQRREIEALRSMAYLSGTTPPTDAVGVTVNVEGVAWPGVNLAVDTHDTGAILMGMNGRALHRWRLEFKQAFPRSSIRPGAEGIQYWRRVHLYEDGGVLAIFEGAGLVRLDVDSRLLWGFEEAVHHDLEVQPGGDIVVLTREASVRPEIHPELPITEDWIVVLSSDGSVRRRVSVLEAIRRSDYYGLLGLTEGHGDLLHTNTVEILDGRLAGVLGAFRAGNALLSFPKIHTIAVLDMDSERIVWALTGLTGYQHDPTVLDSGRLLVFDNWGDGGDHSRVVEIEPLSRRIEWAYEGSVYDFFTRCCGASQRLANGNTLITETDRGRAFEVTPEKRIVWEYLTPHRVGEGPDELVARLFEVERLDESYVASWLASRRRGE
jgi:hypothetical protein